MTATGLICAACGTELPPDSRFCNKCGAPITPAATSAEYKQVTVLFADVVHSMDIAAMVGAERLREIMAELVNRATVVVQRYGGTVDKFTGDGIMAVFGAPLALEDHAIRACLAALGIQEEAKRLAVEVQDRDGVDLQLRVGLNSGQVIAGEVGSRSLGYTTIGEQVGLAQRMESVAAPRGVMLSASTARLVDGVAALGEPEAVRIKGVEEPVTAYRLLGMGQQHRAAGRVESKLVGRRWEMFAVNDLLDRAVEGHGAVVGVVGPPGIGKSRLVREAVTMAHRRGVEVCTTFCESHTSQVAFHAVARLLRASTGVEGLDGQAARDRVRYRFPDADPEDFALFDDLLGITDPNGSLPQIDPDARRRRLIALVNGASLASKTPVLYVVEDAHWIDEVSESMLADFFTVIPQTHSMVVLTYRPEYEGTLRRVHGAQTIALAPLSDSESGELIAELLGPHPTVDGVGHTIVQRAAGNPFFAEEIVRELAGRGVLRGQRGAYISAAEATEVNVPATLQATIAARIDRLNPKAKRTLSAGAVIGSRFGLDLLNVLGVEPVVTELVAAQLVDQVEFTRQPEYVFHHPLIRAVAYEAQLKSDRAELHRRVAAAIEQQDADSLDENAALIAEHLQAAGELHAAYRWHMRAGTWLTNRNINAAVASWRRAQQVADELPADDPDRPSMRIAPRALLCATAFREGGGGTETGFDELRDLCAAAGDSRSLAIGMVGLVTAKLMNADRREASRLATELVRLLESIGDSTMTAALLLAAMAAKHEIGEMAEVLQMAQTVIDAAEGDTEKGNLFIGSPLTFATAMRGVARLCLGIVGWKDDLRQAHAMGRASDPLTLQAVTFYNYTLTIPNGALLPDAMALRDTAETLEMAEQSGDDWAVFGARAARGVALVHREGPDREVGFELLARTRERGVSGRFALLALPFVDIYIAREKALLGDIDGAIALAQSVVDGLFDSGGSVSMALATSVLVDALLQRGEQGDFEDARAAINRLEAVRTDPGFVLHEITLLRLRALLARARADESAYFDYRDRYRAMAKSIGFEGHIAWAEAMP
ncbi:MAG: ATP-binding protein [Candidatus Sericytochromatia bacterium]